MKRFLLFMAGLLLRDAVEAAIVSAKKLKRAEKPDDDLYFPDPNNPKCFRDELDWILSHNEHFLDIEAKLSTKSPQDWEEILRLNEANFLRLWYYPVRYLQDLKKTGIQYIRVRQGSEPLSISGKNKTYIQESFREYNVDEEIQKLT